MYVLPFRALIHTRTLLGTPVIDILAHPVALVSSRTFELRQGTLTVTDVVRVVDDVDDDNDDDVSGRGIFCYGNVKMSETRYYK